MARICSEELGNVIPPSDSCPESGGCAETRTCNDTLLPLVPHGESCPENVGCEEFQGQIWPVELIIECIGHVDDDLKVTKNGETLKQPGLEYWDYVLNKWTNQWRRWTPPPGFAPPHPNTPQFFPITESNRKWNVSWYAGANYATGNFIRIRYRGPMQRLDLIEMFAVDGFQFSWRTSPWKAKVTYSNGAKWVTTGGEMRTGASPNTPSPPLINPNSPPPYQNINQYAAANGMPSYFSQGYPASGPYFEHIEPMGGFVIP
jgi:hypothetical protein